LPGKACLRNDLLCVSWDVKPYTLTQYLVIYCELCDNVTCCCCVRWDR